MNCTTRPRVLAAAVGLTLSLALGACSTATSGTSGTSAVSDSTDAAATASAMSGMASAMSGTTTDGTTAAASDVVHNDTDVMFVQQMIPHHEGAVAMAALAPDRASAQAVKDLAARIAAAQEPEIVEMNGWLEAWNATPGHTMDMGATTDPTETTDGGTAMNPMMSADDMAALTAASGSAFDRLFLEQMIVHHQGAIEMAEVEIGSGADPAALALAASIRSGQSTEIATMQELLAGM